MQHFRIILGIVIGFSILSLLEKSIRWELLVGAVSGYLLSQLLPFIMPNEKAIAVNHLDKEGLIKLRQTEMGAFFILSTLSLFSLMACKYVFHYESISVDFLILFVFGIMFFRWSLLSYFCKRIIKKS